MKNRVKYFITILNPRPNLSYTKMISAKSSTNVESLTQFQDTFVNGGRNSTELPIIIWSTFFWKWFFSSNRSIISIYKKLSLINVRPQKNNNQHFSIIEYPHRTELELVKAHKDYFEQFVLDIRTSLPNGVHLYIDCRLLKKIQEMQDASIVPKQNFHIEVIWHNFQNISKTIFSLHMQLRYDYYSNNECFKNVTKLFCIWPKRIKINGYISEWSDIIICHLWIKSMVFRIIRFSLSVSIILSEMSVSELKNEQNIGKPDRNECSTISLRL
jgi:hypothetical protein